MNMVLGDNFCYPGLEENIRIRSAPMNEIRIIKKYPNRRLYDTVLSHYITLDDVKSLVQNHISIQVIDARTKKDITHSTLLYLIVDQENSDKPLLNPALLEQMIRLHAGLFSTTNTNAAAIYQLVTQAFTQTVDFLSEQAKLLACESMVSEGLALEKLQKQWGKAVESSLKTQAVIPVE